MGWVRPVPRGTCPGYPVVPGRSRALHEFGGFSAPQPTLCKTVYVSTLSRPARCVRRTTMSTSGGNRSTKWRWQAISTAPADGVLGIVDASGAHGVEQDDERFVDEIGCGGFVAQVTEAVEADAGRELDAEGVLGGEAVAGRCAGCGRVYESAKRGHEGILRSLVASGRARWSSIPTSFTRFHQKSGTGPRRGPKPSSRPPCRPRPRITRLRGVEVCPRRVISTIGETSEASTCLQDVELRRDTR